MFSRLAPKPIFSTSGLTLRATTRTPPIAWNKPSSMLAPSLPKLPCAAILDAQGNEAIRAQDFPGKHIPLIFGHDAVAVTLVPGDRIEDRIVAVFIG